MLAPIFVPKYVDLLVSHFLTVSNSMVVRLSHARFVNISQEMHKVALNGVLSALFSSSLSKEFDFANLINRYLTDNGRPHPLDAISSSEHDFALFFRGRRSFARKRKEEIARFVKKRIGLAKETRLSGKDILDLLFLAIDQETKSSLHLEEIEFQVATILFAGFETTSRNLFWTMYLLAFDQESQETARREVNAFPVDKISNMNDLLNWPYLRAVIFESLRLYPLGPNLAREAVKDIAINGVEVKAGEQVWVSPWIIQRHRKFWSDPDRFQPSRFFGHSAPWTMENHIPFGSGPRTCIAANFAITEVMIIIASILGQFRFRIADEKPVIPEAAMTLAPSHEPMFEFQHLSR